MLDKKNPILLTILIAIVLVLVYARASNEAVNGAGSPGATFSMLDKSGSGVITREEFDKEKSLFNGRTFDSLDFGGKGFITQSDLQTAGIDLDENALGTVTMTKPMPAKPRPRPSHAQNKKQNKPSPPIKPNVNNTDQTNRPGS